MKFYVLLLFLAWTQPLAAQTVKIKFITKAEVRTELTSVTDIHAITVAGPYNFHEIETMAFWDVPPDSVTIEKLRTNGVGVYIKNKYLKPYSVKSDKVWEARVAGSVGDADTIRVKGNSYWLGSVKMSDRDILTVLERNPASYDEAKMARSNYNGAQVVGFFAGALIGWPIGQALAGKQDPQWGLAAGGGVLLLAVGVPVASGFKKHTYNAIRIYNKKPVSPGSPGLSMQFIPSVQGATFVVKF